MPKQKTVPTVNPMKTYSIKVNPKIMDRAVELTINTAKIMRSALEKEVAAMAALTEGKCHYCGNEITPKKKKYPRHSLTKKVKK